MNCWNDLLLKSRPIRELALTMCLYGVLITVSCGDKPTEMRSIAVNPYAISSSDIETALLSLSLSSVNKEKLDSLGIESVSNPYAFSDSDVQYASGLKTEEENRLEYILALPPARIGDLIPDQQQIDDGLAYWTSERDDVESARLPFWQNERSRADLAGEQVWLDVCGQMIDLQETLLALIDATLDDLHKDAALIQGTSDESGSAILSRKHSLTDRRIDYYDLLIYTLSMAIGLEIQDFSGLGAFIADTSQFVQRRDYWEDVSDRIHAEDILFWESESDRAAETNNDFWLQFTQHMIENKHIYDTLAQKYLFDLRLDSAIIVGISAENSSAIIERKRGLCDYETHYYLDLVDALTEGMSLGILSNP